MTREQIQSATEDEDKLRVQEFIEMQTKILSAAYEKAMAYTNLIIVAGYASFFALWQLTKDHLNRNQVLWSALLMLFSITLFVVFEIYKAYYSSRTLLYFGKILSDPENQSSLARLVSEIEKYNLDDRKRYVRFGRTWHIVFIVTVFSGLSAAVILVYALVRSLFAA
jgi:hypothetical protein